MSRRLHPSSRVLPAAAPRLPRRPPTTEPLSSAEKRTRGCAMSHPHPGPRLRGSPRHSGGLVCRLATVKRASAVDATENRAAASEGMGVFRLFASGTPPPHGPSRREFLVRAKIKSIK